MDGGSLADIDEQLNNTINTWLEREGVQSVNDAASMTGLITRASDALWPGLSERTRRKPKTWVNSRQP